MSLNVYVVTFNCGRQLVQPDAFAPHLFSALGSESRSPELLVLCLQELAPISYAFLGGSFLEPYFAAFRKVVRLACKNSTYVNVTARNLGLTALMIFARDDAAGHIRWLHSAGVGVGVSEMGNKGAVGVRLGYQRPEQEETQFTFVAAHLTPMEDGLAQRNRDYQSIVERLVFVSDAGRTTASQAEQEEDTPLLQGLPTGHTSVSETGMYAPTCHLFFAGDLNYRTSLLQPSPEDVTQRFPQPAASPSDPRHFVHLLGEDQLTQQVKLGKTLHGLTEAAIDFPPTYKYDPDPSQIVTVDGDQPWRWARHRWPSWCDRVFFRTSGSHRVEVQKYTSLPLFATSDHRPVALAASVPLGAILPGADDAKAPFSLDPDWARRRALARKKELVVGVLAYLALTTEGNGLLLGTLVGAVGGYLVLRSLLLG